jgi:hypothetical protein
MANELQKFYGIKEVADVRFYLINDEDNVKYDSRGYVDDTAGTCVLSLDTLKVSNIEFTAEQTEARGGKGNAPLIVWDYGREINVTLEDALMSLEMLQLLNGVDDFDLSGGVSNCIEINPNTFPGTYTVIGKTFARDTDGKDRYFTFVIPKAKIQSETTLTMEADGDPSVFSMTLRVLRNGEQPMMELILDENTSVSESNTAIHWGSDYDPNFKDDGELTGTWKLKPNGFMDASHVGSYDVYTTYMGEYHDIMYVQSTGSKITLNVGSNSPDVESKTICLYNTETRKLNIIGDSTFIISGINSDATD